MFKGRLVFEIEDRHQVKDPAPVDPIKVQIAEVDFCLSELRAGTHEIRQQLVLISPLCESKAEAERLTRVAEASLITLALERRCGKVLAQKTPPPKFTAQWLEERSDATGISCQRLNEIVQKLE